jgi:hypothetical protein
MIPPSQRVLYKSDENRDLKNLIQKFETLVDTSQFAAMAGGAVTGALSNRGASLSSQKIVGRGTQIGEDLGTSFKNFQKQLTSATKNLKVMDKGVEAFSKLPSGIQDFLKTLKPLTDNLGKLNKGVADTTKRLGTRAFTAADNFSKSSGSLETQVRGQRKGLERTGSFLTKQQENIDTVRKVITAEETLNPGSVKNFTKKVQGLDLTQSKVTSSLIETEKQLKAADRLLANRNKILEVEGQILELSKEASIVNSKNLENLNKQLAGRLDFEAKQASQLKNTKLAENTKLINTFEKGTQQNIQSQAAKLSNINQEKTAIKATLGKGNLDAKGLEQSTSALKSLEIQQKKVVEAIENEQRVLNSLNKLRGEASEVTLKNADDVAKLASQLGESSVKLSAISKGFQAYIQATDAVLTLTISVKAFIALTEGMQDITRAINGTEQALVLMQKQGFDISGFEEFSKLKDIMTLNTEVITDFATTAVAQFNAFNESLNQVGTVFQTGLDFETRKEELKEFGLTIQNLVNKELSNSVTETEALSATYEALSGGFTTATSSAKVMEAGLKLAASSGADSGEVMRLLTKTLNAYGKDSSEAAKTAAQLNTIVESGITTIAELSNGFGQLSTVSNAVGISIEDTGAALAVLTTRGTSTAQAMTQLQSLFTTFIDPDFQKKLESMKIDLEINKATVEAEGLVTTMAKLDKALGGSTVKWGQLLPDIQAYRAALTLTSDGLTNLEKVSQKMANTTAKNLQEVFDIRLKDSQVTKFTQVVNKLNSTLISVGRTLAPILDTGVNYIQSFTEKTAGWVEGNLGLIKVLTQLAFGIKAVEGVTGALVGTAAKLFGIFTTWRFLTGGLITDMGALFKLTAGGSAQVAAATGTFNKLGAALSNNVVLGNANLKPFEKMKILLGNITGIGAKSGEQLIELSSATGKSAAEIGKLNTAVTTFTVSGFAKSLGEAGKAAGKGAVDGFKALLGGVKNVASALGSASKAAWDFANTPLISGGAGAVVIAGAALAGFGASLKIVKEQTEDLRSTLTKSNSNFTEFQKSLEGLTFGKRDLSELSAGLITDELSKVSDNYSAEAKTFLTENQKILQEFDNLKAERKNLEKTEATQKNDLNTPIEDLEKTQKALSDIDAQIETSQKQITQNLGKDLELRVTLINQTAEELLNVEQSFIENLVALEDHYKFSLGNIGETITDFTKSTFNSDVIEGWAHSLEDAFKGAGQWFDNVFGGNLENKVNIDKSIAVAQQGFETLNALNLKNAQIVNGAFITSNKIVDGKKVEIDLQKELNELYTQGGVLTDDQLRNFRENIKINQEELQVYQEAVQKSIDYAEAQIAINEKVLKEGGKFSIEQNISSANKESYLNEKSYNPLVAAQKLALKESDLWANPNWKNAANAGKGIGLGTALYGAIQGAGVGFGVAGPVGAAVGGVAGAAPGLIGAGAVAFGESRYRQQGTDFVNSLKEGEFEQFLALENQKEKEKFILSKLGTDNIARQAARDLSSDRITKLLESSNAEGIESSIIAGKRGKDFLERDSSQNQLKQIVEQLELVNKNIKQAITDLKVFENIATLLENRIDLSKPNQITERYEKRIGNSVKRLEASKRAMDFLGNYKNEDGTTYSQEQVTSSMQDYQKNLREKQKLEDAAFLQFQKNNADKLAILSEADRRKEYELGDSSTYDFKGVQKKQEIDKSFNSELTGPIRDLEKKDKEAYDSALQESEDPSSGKLVTITEDIGSELSAKNISAAKALQDFDKNVMPYLDQAGDNLTALLETRVDLIRAATEEIISLEENHAARLSTIYEGIGAESAKQSEVISKIRLKNSEETLKSEQEILKGMRENGQYSVEQIKEQEEAVKQMKADYLVQRMDFVRQQAEAEVQVETDKINKLKTLTSSEFTSNTPQIQQLQKAEEKLIEARIIGEKRAYNELAKSGQATAQQKKDHLNKIEEMETEYLVTRLANIEENLKRELDVQQLSLDKRKTALEYYTKEALLPEATIEKRNIELQMEGAEAYRNYLEKKLDLTKQNGGDTSQLLAELQANFFETESLITDSFKVELNERAQARDAYFEQAQLEVGYIKERIATYGELTQVVLQNFEALKNSSTSDMGQIRIDRDAIQFQQDSLEIEFETKKRIIQLDQELLNYETQSKIESEQSRSLVAAQIVAQKELNLSKAQTTEEITFATEQLNLALDSQQRINTEVENNVASLEKTASIQQTKYEIAKATLEVDKEIASLNLQAASVKNQLDYYNELTNLAERFSDITSKSVQTGERIKSLSEEAFKIQQEMDKLPEDSEARVELAEKINEIQKKIAEEEEILRKQQLADERALFESQKASLEIRQTVEDKLFELSNKTLELQNKKLEIETQITNQKLEQEKIDLRKQNEDLKVRNEKIKEEYDKADTDEKRNALKKELDRNQQQMDLNSDVIKTNTDLQQINSELTASTIANNEALALSTQAIHELKQSIEKAEFIVRSNASTAQEKANAQKSVSSLKDPVNNAQNSVASQIKNMARGGEVAENLGVKVLEAMEREGAGAVPIVAKVGEEVLTVADAKVYRNAKANGDWEQLQTKIPNYSTGGSVNYGINNDFKYSQNEEYSGNPIARTDFNGVTRWYNSSGSPTTYDRAIASHDKASVLKEAKDEYSYQLKNGGVSINDYINKPGSKQAGSVTSHFESQGEYIGKRTQKRDQAKSLYDEFAAQLAELEAEYKELNELPFEEKNTNEFRQRYAEVLRGMSEARGGMLQNQQAASATDKSIAKGFGNYLFDQKMEGLKISGQMMGVSLDSELRRIERDRENFVRATSSKIVGNYAEGGTVTDKGSNTRPKNPRGMFPITDGMSINVPFGGRGGGLTYDAGITSLKRLMRRGRIGSRPSQNKNVLENTSERVEADDYKKMLNSLYYQRLGDAKTAYQSQRPYEAPAARKVEPSIDEKYQERIDQINSNYSLTEARIQQSLDAEQNKENPNPQLLGSLERQLSNAQNVQGVLLGGTEKRFQALLEKKERKQYSSELSMRDRSIPSYLDSASQRSDLSYKQVAKASKNAPSVGSANSLKIDQDINFNMRGEGNGDSNYMKYVEKRFKEENERTSKNLEKELQYKMF